MDRVLKRYKAGIYARLSSGQADKSFTRYSKEESINAQIEISEHFIQEFNKINAGESIEVVKHYTDLGKTGTSFERDAFMQLMQDIKLGKIDCVIVKDLSRFGRNYLEAGNYIEKVFPFLGVRFIAVADNYDTGAAGNENKQMAIEIKNLVNDIYAKDFSKKAKVSLRQRREDGSYVGGPPPYGYIAVRNGKKRVLAADNKTSGIVKFIYEEFARTGSFAKVTDKLNERKVNPPSVYKRTKSVYYLNDSDNYKPWDKSAVVRILKSDTYFGMLVQGKTAITERNEKKRISRSENEWVIIKNAHEPLIDFDLYKKVVEIRDNRG